MAQWTTKQEQIVLMYASLGAKFIVAEIEAVTGVKRSIHSVEQKASRLGVSLVQYQVCPRCGKKVEKLNRITGLCKYCNVKELRDNALKDRARLMREIHENEKDTPEFERVNHEYLAISRSNQRLAKEHGIPPKRSRGTHWEREVLGTDLGSPRSDAEKN